jgi:hypothetical protein
MRRFDNVEEERKNNNRSRKEETRSWRMKKICSAPKKGIFIRENKKKIIRNIRKKIYGLRRVFAIVAPSPLGLLHSRPFSTFLFRDKFQLYYCTISFSFSHCIHFRERKIIRFKLKIIFIIICFTTCTLGSSTSCVCVCFFFNYVRFNICKWINKIEQPKDI